jgi:hypothetical protein
MATNDENEQFYDATEEIISNYIKTIDFLIKFVTHLDDDNDDDEPENEEFRKILEKRFDEDREKESVEVNRLI